MTAPDIESTNSGTVITLRPLTKRGRAELYRLKTEPWQWSVLGLACEPRIGVEVIRFLVESGFRVRDSETGRIAGAEQ